MLICQYCNTENEDGEKFCNNCGRPLSVVSKAERTPRQDSSGIWSVVQIPHYQAIDEVSISPKTQLFSDGRFQLNYAGVNCTLGEYYERFELNYDKLIKLMSEIFDVLMSINGAGYIVGSCDFDDFVITEDDRRLKLRIRRPLFKKELYIENYECGEFCAPEIRNMDEKQISERADVYVAAMIFNRLVLRNKYVKSDIENQVKHAFYMAVEDYGREYAALHSWLGISLNMFVGKRFESIETSKDYFDQCVIDNNCACEKNIRFSHAMKTSVGTGKNIFFEEIGRKKEERNEDALSVYESPEKHFYAYLLADGISNCEVGSGFIASSIVKECFESVVNQLDEESEVDENWINTNIQMIVRQSNEKIREKALLLSSDPHNVMGSTIVLAFILNNYLYYFCLGDSILFLIRNGKIIPLSQTDNIETSLLQGKISTNQENLNLAALTQYIGGKYAIEVKKYDREINRINLDEGDYIVLASDGVLDCLGNNVFDSKWDKEQILLRKVVNHKDDIKHAVELMIRQGNANGGTDNMSIILIKGEAWDE